MAVVNLYSTDAGAPVLTGTVGSQVALLDWALPQLGWTKEFSGTNKAAYKGGAQSNGHYLQVIDDTTVTSASGRWAKWTGYETMSTNVDTGTGLFPTAAQVSGGLHVYKSKTNDSTPRAWALIGDDLGFYFFSWWSDSTYINHAAGYWFGKTGSLRESDGYDTLIIGDVGTTSIPSYPGQYNLCVQMSTYNATQIGKYYARSHTQIGSAVAAGTVAAAGANNSGMGANGFTYPYPVTNGMLISVPSLAETSLIRCMQMPGMYYPQHTAPLSNLDLLTDIPSLPGKTLQAITCGYGGSIAQCFIDITGPWTR